MIQQVALAIVAVWLASIAVIVGSDANDVQLPALIDYVANFVLVVAAIPSIIIIVIAAKMNK